MTIRPPAILDREMSRGEFLQHIGVGILLLLSGGLISQFISGAGQTGLKDSAKSYGNRTYGG
jgi:hypothetical protein